MNWNNSNLKDIYTSNNIKLKENINLCYYDSCIENNTNNILTIKMIYSKNKCYITWNRDHVVILCEILNNEFILDINDTNYIKPLIEYNCIYYEYINVNKLIIDILNSDIDSCIIHYNDINSLKISSMWVRYLAYGDDDSLLEDELNRLNI